MAINLVMTQTYVVKQFNFAIEREDGSTLFIKVFNAPYSTWWCNTHGEPVELTEPEKDGIFNYLRSVQRVRQQANIQRQTDYNESSTAGVVQS